MAKLPWAYDSLLLSTVAKNYTNKLKHDMIDKFQLEFMKSDDLW